MWLALLPWVLFTAGVAFALGLPAIVRRRRNGEFSVDRSALTVDDPMPPRERRQL